jgi:protein subunit release factor A
MAFEKSDIRLEIFRDASMRWRGNGKYTHLPTGIVETFEVSWADRSQQKAAFEKLEARVNGQSD